jgi:hypothetical protein
MNYEVSRQIFRRHASLMALGAYYILRRLWITERCCSRRTSSLDVVLVPWLRQLPASHRGYPGLIPTTVHVGFVVDKVATGQIFSPRISVFIFLIHMSSKPYNLSS